MLRISLSFSALLTATLFLLLNFSSVFATGISGLPVAPMNYLSLTFPSAETPTIVEADTITDGNEISATNTLSSADAISDTVPMTGTISDSILESELVTTPENTITPAADSVAAATSVTDTTNRDDNKPITGSSAITNGTALAETTEVTPTNPITDSEDTTPLSAVKQFTVTAVQENNGSSLTIEVLEVSQQVTLTLKDLLAEIETDSILTSTVLISDLYESLVITFPIETRPLENTFIAIEVSALGDIAPSRIVTVELKLVAPPALVAYDLVENQIGAGDFITISRIYITEPITVTVYPAQGDTLALDNKSQEVFLEIGRYKNLELVVDTRFDTMFYIGLLRSNGALAYTRLPVNLQVRPALRSIDYGAVQTNDGTKITISDLQVSQDVTIAVQSDLNGIPSVTPIATRFVEARTPKLPLEIAVPEIARPITSTLFWVQVIGTNPITLLEQVSVTLQLTTVVKAPTYKEVLVTEGSLVSVTNLLLGQKATVRLRSDREDESDASTLDEEPLEPGQHDLVELEVPEARRPMTNTTYWLDILDSNDKIVWGPQEIDIRLSESEEEEQLQGNYEFVVDSNQSNDGTSLAIDSVRTSAQITVAVQGDNEGVPDPQNILGEVRLADGIHTDETILFYPDKFLLANTTVWVRRYGTNGQEIGDALPVDLHFIPSLAVQAFTVESPQPSDGTRLVIKELEVSRPVTVVVSVSTIPTSTVRIVESRYEADHYQNLSLQIPPEHRIMTDTTVLIEIILDDSIPAVQEEFVEVTFTEPSDPTALLPSIKVRDQESDGFTATFDEISAPQAGWLLVYEEQRNGQEVLAGHGYVNQGKTPNFQVPFLTRQLPRGAVLHAVLHSDTGVIGIMEYPASDPPMLRGENTVAATFVLAKPGVRVSTQTSYGDLVIIDEVIVGQPGWLVLYNTTGDVLGSQAVSLGLHQNVAVTLNTPLSEGTHALHVALHRDTGDEDSFAFPGSDPVVLVDEQIVNQQFQVNVVAKPQPTGMIEQDGYATVVKSQIVIDHVTTPVNSWLLLLCDTDTRSSVYCGYMPLPAGEYQDVAVQLELIQGVKSPLIAQLYSDEVELGIFELDGPDKPLLENGRPVTATIDLPPPAFIGDTGKNMVGTSWYIPLSVASVLVPLFLSAYIQKRRTLAEFLDESETL